MNIEIEGLAMFIHLRLVVLGMTLGGILHTALIQLRRSNSTFREEIPLTLVVVGPNSLALGAVASMPLTPAEYLRVLLFHARRMRGYRDVGLARDRNSAR